MASSREEAIKFFSEAVEEVGNHLPEVIHRVMATGGDDDVQRSATQLPGVVATVGVSKIYFLTLLESYYAAKKG
jgi:hypothetical protein